MPLPSIHPAFLLLYSHASLPPFPLSSLVEVKFSFPPLWCGNIYSIEEKIGTVLAYMGLQKPHSLDGYISVMLSFLLWQDCNMSHKESCYSLWGRTLRWQQLWRRKAALYQIRWDLQISLTYMSPTLVPPNVILKVMFRLAQAEFLHLAEHEEREPCWDLTWQPRSSDWGTA